MTRSTVLAFLMVPALISLAKFFQQQVPGLPISLFGVGLLPLPYFGLGLTLGYAVQQLADLLENLAVFYCRRLG